MSHIEMAHLRLSLPFTILHAKDTVHLIAGEDFRYTLTGRGIESWLPDFLREFDGHQTVKQLLNKLDISLQSTAKDLIEQLSGERVLIEVIPLELHQAQFYTPIVQGSGALCAGLQNAFSQSSLSGQPLKILCQDTLDYEEVLRFNEQCQREKVHRLWATTGPMARGFVSPLCLPNTGPCLACLIRHFKRLSPMSSLYDALIDHVRQGGLIAQTDFPSQGIEILKSLILWKVSIACQTESPPALYRLHVLETHSLEISSYRVFTDPECPQCQGSRKW